MLLITEYLDNTTRPVIEEAADGRKNLYLEGIFAQAEQKNRNGRIYPLSILLREVTSYNENFVKTNRALGELNHPQSPQINPREACHRIVELRQNGNDFYGKALVLNTPTGNIVRGLVEGGTQMGVSTRGLGTVKTNTRGINEIQSDFRLVCVDVVSDPSAPDAFVNGIMEGHEWVMAGDRIVEQHVEKIRKQVMRLPAKAIHERKLRAFEEYMDLVAAVEK